MVDTIEEPNEVFCNRPELSQTVTRTQIPIADMTELRRNVPSIVKGCGLLISRGATWKGAKVHQKKLTKLDVIRAALPLLVPVFVCALGIYPYRSINTCHLTKSIRKAFKLHVEFRIS
jgi:hypothetical protein